MPPSPSVVELRKVSYYDAGRPSISTISREMFEHDAARDAIIKKNVFGHRWVLKINEVEAPAKNERRRLRVVVYLVVFCCIVAVVLFGMYFTLEPAFLEASSSSSNVINTTVQKPQNHITSPSVDPSASGNHPQLQLPPTTTQPPRTTIFTIPTTKATTTPPVTMTTTTQRPPPTLPRLSTTSPRPYYTTTITPYYTTTVRTTTEPEEEEEEEEEEDVDHEDLDEEEEEEDPEEHEEEEEEYDEEEEEPPPSRRPPPSRPPPPPPSRPPPTPPPRETYRNVERRPALQFKPTTTLRPPPARIWHMCDNCKLNGGVCLKVIENAPATCVPPLDRRDPTGCGGLCLRNSQYCKLLDAELQVYQCKNVDNILRCPQNTFNCGNRCIARNKRCDGFFDCSNYSDEHNCECNLDTHFHCGNQTSCIVKNKKCDGRLDCWDKSDEKDCNRDCSESELPCQNGQCIAIRRFCDGNFDCFDKSDEPWGCT